MNTSNAKNILQMVIQRLWVHGNIQDSNFQVSIFLDSLFLQNYHPNLSGSEVVDHNELVYKISSSMRT
jgi:hypothetical protein